MSALSILSDDFNLNHYHVNAAPNQASFKTTSRPLSTPPCNPQAELLYVKSKCTRLNTNLTQSV